MLPKFRKKGTALALASIMGGLGVMAAPAHAVNLADDGLGEVLLYQYYTIRNDWQTFFHIINTSDQTVAARVRFREAENSRDVLDFVIVLSPFDVWTAYTGNNAAGEPVLRTVDTSCTAPTFQPVAGANPHLREAKFRDLAYTGNVADGGTGSIDRVREGHVEIISLGHSDPNGDIARSANHDPVTGLPNNCGAIASAFNSNSPATLAGTAEQFGEPINALKGNGYLIKVTNGQGGGFDPVVLANFYNPGIRERSDSCGFGPGPVLCLNGPGGGDGAIGIDGTGQRNLIRALYIDEDWYTTNGDTTNPNPGPSLNSAYPPISRVDDDTTGVGPRTIYDEWDRGVDAVSAVLARASVINEWAARDADGAFNNTTEWVVTFPTKNFYVDGGPEVNTRNNATIDEDLDPIKPFSETFDTNAAGDDPPNDDAGNPTAAAGQSCDTVIAWIWDREERSVGGLSPFPPELKLDLCYETNVITFRGEVLTPVLGSAVATNIATSDLPEDIAIAGAYFGWMDLDLTYEDAAWDGLGSDPNADQTYDQGSSLPVEVETAEMTKFCSQFYNDGTAAFPPGFGPANPPAYAGEDNNGISYTPGANPDFDDVGGRRFQNTLVLKGVNAAPLIAVAKENVVTVSNGQCDDPTTPANEQVNATVSQTGSLKNSAKYSGLPVVGWMVSFRTLAANPSLNYSTILQHGYDRDIYVKAWCRAVFSDLEYSVTTEAEDTAQVVSSNAIGKRDARWVCEKHLGNNDTP